MKRAWPVSAVLLLLAGCSSLPASQAANAGQQVPLPTVSATAPAEPAVRLQDGRILLPEGFSGPIPQGAYAAASRLLLQGADEEVANISFNECPKGAPDSGCVDNHRGITARGSVTVAGNPVSRFEANYQKNSAAGDNRTWLELHTVVPLPSGRRIDIVGQVLAGSGKEPLLRSVYEELIGSLGRS